MPDGLEICNLLGVSRTTVIKAMDILVEKGLVVRKRKAGSFVQGVRPVLIPSIGFFYFHEAVVRMARVAEYMQRAFARLNYDLKVISFDKDFYDTSDLLIEVKRRGLDGAVIVPLDRESCLNGLLQLEEAKFPLVRIGNSYFSGKLKSPVVVGNESKKCKDLIAYLWNLGHRRIGLITSSSGSDVELEYLKHYGKYGGLEERWLMCMPFTGHPRNWSSEDLTLMCNRYLKENPDVTAIAVAHPSVCLEILSRAQAMGITVPGELSLVSLVDYGMLLDSVNPSITSMLLSEKFMGETASDALYKIISQGIPDTEERIELDYELVERNSVRPIK